MYNTPERGGGGGRQGGPEMPVTRPRRSPMQAEADVAAFFPAPRRKDCPRLDRNLPLARIHSR